MQQAELDMLVIMAQQGDERALLTLFSHLNPALLQFAYRLTKELSLAQDATQTAWLKVVSHITELKNPRLFRSWLYRAVRWASIDLLRQQQINLSRYAEQGVEDIAEDQTDSNGDLNAAIASLPADEYQAIYLFYFAQLSLLDIALIQEVPVGTVKTRLYRARTKLKIVLENEQ